MPNKNLILIAAAGAGKTTRIVNEAIQNSNKRILITTYTNNNTDEIRKKFYQLNGAIPQNVTIQPLFTFFLYDFVRPYQSFIYKTKRIESINFHEGCSPWGISEDHVVGYYLTRNGLIHRDKLSKFAIRCNELSRGLSIKRLTQLYDHIYIDEVQDLAGWDLEIVELLFNSSMHVTLVGDPRQSSFSTNDARKNSAYKGINITKKFAKWEKAKLCSIEPMIDCYRSNQTICDFADSIFPSFPKTSSLNRKTTNHDGLFIVPPQKVPQYMQQFSPEVLRYNKNETCQGYPARNFKVSKGLTFERTLIFPTGPIKKLLKTGDFQKFTDSDEGRCTLYVAVTRARHSLAFVYDGTCSISGFSTYS